MENLETGVEYPKVKLGDVEYEVKFTRAILYRLDKAGITFNPTIKPGGATCGLANMMDTLHMVIGFPGTVEELTELAYDKRDEVLTALVTGWGKVVLPSLTARAASTAAKQQERIPQTVQ